MQYIRWFSSSPFINPVIFPIMVFLSIILYSNQTLAFACETQGAESHYGTTYIDAPVHIETDSRDVPIIDMSKYVTCYGAASPYNDALRMKNLVLPSSLQDVFQGYIETGGIKYVNPVAGQCVWIDSQCGTVVSSMPLNMKVGLRYRSESV